MSRNAGSVGEVLDALDDLAEDDNDVTVGEVVEALGGRGFGPLILLPALLVLTPLGGIPAFPTLMAAIIALIAGQIVLGRDGLWLPGLIEKRGVSDDRIERAVSRLRPVADWLDRHLGSRLTTLVKPPAPSLAGGVIIALCAFVPPSEIIPFAAIVPMGAIALLALALTLRDGVVMALGLAGSAAALWALWTFIL